MKFPVSVKPQSMWEIPAPKEAKPQAAQPYFTHRCNECQGLRLSAPGTCEECLGYMGGKTPVTKSRWKHFASSQPRVCTHCGNSIEGVPSYWLEVKPEHPHHNRSCQAGYLFACSHECCDKLEI